jgi:hypothetical protein
MATRNDKLYRSVKTTNVRRDEVIEDWRKLHDKKFRKLYSFENTIRQIKKNEEWHAWERRGE